MNIQKYCLDKNFYFDDDTLYNFHCCLQTKPFTILYGPSGTGKSKIAELYADFICDKKGLELDKHLCFVPVRSNWTAPSDLMGFYDYLNGQFVPSDFYNFMLKAEGDQGNPYFLILDEMNLSVVEHYFSDFLACIESRRLIRQIGHDFEGWQNQVTTQTYTTLSQATILAFIDLIEKEELSLTDSFPLSILREHDIVMAWKDSNFGGQDTSWTPQFRTEFNQKDSAGNNSRLAGKFFENVSSGIYRFKQQKSYALNELSVDVVKRLLNIQVKIEQHPLEIYKNSNEVKSMPIPLNLYIIGTINMDESTHALSSKVLDRVNTIEMNNVSRDILTTQASQDGSLKVDHLNHDFSTIKAIPTINSAKKLNQNKPELIELIYSINDGLNPYRTNMGHRSIFEITHYVNQYIAECNDESLAEEALDLQFCQKLIPKLMGADERVELSILHTVSIITTGELNNPDHVLNADMTQYKYPKTLNKLQRMYKYYTQTGFVNFANV
ncbi:AAA family ATPase [Pseudoalteromonas sp. K222D]|uniref:McrB family protein n=1 Tax=Pseudoalteromonas sp. K222D TaxID=2820756 RepID=UPI001AD6918B|nr:AAA family ATPase [Pseudoalteromonas sp. K222D]MBO7928067.1 AAA family ATPase [Pseudoalteromonas sp. K222D]